MIVADPEKLADRRKRLASLSWFMRTLCEPMARIANREDSCSGRFWEGRFKSQILLDETAVLACSMYVDLNPIRAGIAATPETSEFTSAYERIAAWQESQLGETAATSTATRETTEPCGPPIASRDGWLSPVPDGDVRPSAAPAASTVSARRASDRGFLPMTLDAYLTLLDWTGRQVRADKRGAIPDDLRPILERLQVNAETWVESVVNFGRWFHRAVGRASSMAARAKRNGKCWFQGIGQSKLVFT